MHAGILGLFENDLRWPLSANGPSSMSGYACNLKFAANKYAVNVTVCLNNTDAFICYTIHMFCLMNNILYFKNRAKTKALLWEMRGGPTDCPTRIKSKSIDLTDTDLLESPQKIFLYLVHLLKYQDKAKLPNNQKAKVFSPCPMCAAVCTTSTAMVVCCITS